MKSKDIRKKAWDALSGKWDIMLLIFLIYSLIMGVASSTMVGSLLLVGPFSLSLAAITVGIFRGKEPKIPHLFDGFNNFTKSFVLSIVNSILIWLWSLLFVIPGIIKSYSYAMSFYILNDNPEMTQAEARAASEKMMNGHKWELFCLHFSFIGWMLLVVVTFGIASLWVNPYMQAADAAFYENLKNSNTIEVL